MADSTSADDLAFARLYSYFLSPETSEAANAALDEHLLGSEPPDAKRAKKNAVSDAKEAAARNSAKGINQTFRAFARSLFGTSGEEDRASAASVLKANKHVVKYLVCLSHCVCNDHRYLCKEVIHHLFEEPTVYTGLDVVPYSEHMPQVHLKSSEESDTSDIAYAQIFASFFAEFKYAAMQTCCMLRDIKEIYWHYKELALSGHIIAPGTACAKLSDIYRRMYHLMNDSNLESFAHEFLARFIPSPNSVRNGMTLWYFWKVLVIAGKRKGQFFLEALKEHSQDDSGEPHSLEHDNIQYVVEYIESNQPYSMTYRNVGICLDGKIDFNCYGMHIAKVQQDNERRVREANEAARSSS